MLLQAQGQLAEAEPLFREALKKSPGAQPQGLQKGLWAVDLESLWFIDFSRWIRFFFWSKLLMTGTGAV